VAKARARVARLSFPLRATPVPNGVEPPPPVRHTGTDFDTDWARSQPARVARLALVEGVMRPVMSLVASPAVKGLDRLDRLDGPVIFAANHHSHADTPLMLTTVPEPWRHRLVVGAAADYFFRTRIGGSIAALAIGAIPIERTKVGRQSASLATDLIGDGWSLLIFPEGGRSPDGWGQPFRGGAAYLAIRCNVPVVPVHLQGTGRILRKGKKLPQPSRTTVTFGDPLQPGEDENSRAFAARLGQALGTDIETGEELKAIKHSITFRRVTLRPRLLETGSFTIRGKPSFRWALPEELGSVLPVSSLCLKIADRLS
jgi:1-acyl-sn-glycerol-3-phosphate acyltransferase